MFYASLAVVALLAALFCFGTKFRENLLEHITRHRVIYLLLLATGLTAFYIFGLPTLLGMMPAAFGMIFQLLFAMLFMVVQFGAMMYFMSRARVYWIMPGEAPISFADYKGNPEVLDRAKQVVSILKGAATPAAKKMGLQPIRGMLLEGPPGTGKSYLAQAIAGEAGVPFAYASAPSLESAFMGMSAMTIWRLYGKANKMADRYGSCILFFDEIDAIGRSRAGNRSPGMGGMMGGFMGGGGSQILNELLTQMDPPPTTRTWTQKMGNMLRRIFGMKPKFASRGNVLTIGATNLMSTLDQALLRPGRFDRHITVDLPSSVGRREIIDFYLGKVQHTLTEEEIQRLVRSTLGYSPVALKHIINEGLVLASSDHRDHETFTDVQHAQEIHEWGISQPILTMTPDEKRRIAYHEAGHAVAGVLLRKSMKVEKATIIRRGNALGLVGSKPLEEKHTYTKADIFENIDVSVASRAVEEEILDLQMSGFTGDLSSATSSAIALVAQTGMGSRLISYAALGMTASPMVVNEAATLIEIRYRLVKEFITRNREAVEAVAERLLVEPDLDGPVVEELVMKNAQFVPTRPLHIELADMLSDEEKLRMGNVFSEKLGKKPAKKDEEKPQQKAAAIPADAVDNQPGETTGGESTVGEGEENDSETDDEESPAAPVAPPSAQVDPEADAVIRSTM